MEPKEMLKKARQLIEKPENWTKHIFYEKGRYCLLGAVQGVFWGQGIKMLRNDHYSTACALLSRCVEREGITQETEYGPEKVTEITEFNDLPQTTHADVLRILDCAIEEAGNV